MVNPIYQQGEELLLNQFGSKYLGIAAHTNVNSNEFIVQEDAVISVLTGGDSSTAANNVDYKVSMGLSDVTLKQGALIVAPQGESFQSMTIDSGTIMAYNSVVGGTKPSAVPLLLDLYPDAAAAYSLRKLRTDYTGPAIEARKTVAGATSIQDIGFVDGELDTALLLTFAGSDDVFVAKWYDQSGNGNNAAQASESAQPQIVSSGAVIKVNNVSAVDFDGFSNYLETATFTEIEQPTSYFGVFKFDDNKNQNIFDGSSSGRQIIGEDGTSYKLYGGIQTTGGVSNTNQSSFNGFFSDTDSLFINNISITSGNAGVDGIDKMVIGSNFLTNGAYLDGKIQELILYPSDQTSNRIVIESNINSHYNIYWDGSQSGLLDDYPNASAAYSLRALNSAYTGAAIRVRRSSDNTEQDIKLLYDGNLDTASLLSFVGAGDGFVTVWYDQSGAGNSIVQSNTAFQPQIVLSGSLITKGGLVAVDFNGVNHKLVTGNAVLNATSVSHFTVSSSNNTETIGAVLCQSNTTIQTIRIFNDARIATNRNMAVSSSAISYFADLSTPRVDTNQRLLSSFVDSSKNMSAFDNGATGGTDTYIGTVDNTIGLTIGAQFNLTYLDGKIQEIIAYNTDQSANRETIEANINTHYTIY